MLNEFSTSIASNEFRFMNFRDKHKSFDENTPTNQNFVIFKKKIDFVCFPLFYDPQHKTQSLLVGFVHNKKNLGNRQTMKKQKLWKENKQTFI